MWTFFLQFAVEPSFFHTLAWYCELPVWTMEGSILGHVWHLQWATVCCQNYKLLSCHSIENNSGEDRKELQPGESILILIGPLYIFLIFVSGKKCRWKMFKKGLLSLVLLDLTRRCPIAFEIKYGFQVNSIWYLWGVWRQSQIICGSWRAING